MTQSRSQLQIWRDRLSGNMACLVGIHHWSDWEVQDPQRPSQQVRTCARCPRTKNNAAVVPLRSLFWLGACPVTCGLARDGGLMRGKGINYDTGPGLSGPRLAFEAIAELEAG